MKLEAVLVTSQVDAPNGPDGTMPLPEANSLAALLETVRLRLEEKRGRSRFPLVWRLGEALAGDSGFGWIGAELDRVILETQEIESELERLPASLGAIVMLGDEGHPEIYGQESTSAEKYYQPPNLRTRFGVVLESIRSVCNAARETGCAVALVRTGDPVQFLWSVDDPSVDG